VRMGSPKKLYLVFGSGARRNGEVGVKDEIDATPLVPENVGVRRLGELLWDFPLWKGLIELQMILPCSLIHR
jgi:hypothetical protein